jgi:hypothetical protein
MTGSYLAKISGLRAAVALMINYDSSSEAK